MKHKKALMCMLIGIALYMIAEISDSRKSTVEKGLIYRYDCGKGDAEYEFYVDSLDGKQEKMTIVVPEQKMSSDQFFEKIPEIKDSLKKQILGENSNFNEIRSNLKLAAEAKEYGVLISWSSDRPEIVSRTGVIYTENVTEGGENVCLKAVISCGQSKEIWEIPITVYPKFQTKKERFERLLDQLLYQNMEQEVILLPTEFENETISYRSTAHRKNITLLLLGVIGTVCLCIKEKNNQREKKRQREEWLLTAYQELVSGFLILTGAGYPSKAAWKKLIKDLREVDKKQVQILVQEMQITENQMDTGTPETQAYAAFGRRCGVRCYIRFASLLESNLNTGGKNLKRLLETELDEAFKERVDMAKRKGEEASSKLLIPMFGMLGVVMVMAAAPAFLSMN